jgi:hypothetical protein
MLGDAKKAPNEVRVPLTVSADVPSLFSVWRAVIAGEGGFDRSSELCDVRPVLNPDEAGLPVTVLLEGGDLCETASNLFRERCPEAADRLSGVKIV